MDRAPELSVEELKIQKLRDFETSLKFIAQLDKTKKLEMATAMYLDLDWFAKTWRITKDEVLAVAKRLQTQAEEEELEIV